MDVSRVKVIQHPASKLAFRQLVQNASNHKVKEAQAFATRSSKCPSCKQCLAGKPTSFTSRKRAPSSDLLQRRHMLALGGLSLVMSADLRQNALADSASESSSSTQQPIIQLSPRDVILRILEEQGDAKKGGWETLYAEKEVQQKLDEAVTALVAKNPTEAPGSRSVQLGQGTWEVFYAPHITRLSSVGATKFEPIRYILRGEHIDSNVRYKAPLIGSGWLSAAGSFREKDSETVEVLFDSFWWDTGADALKADPAGKGSLLTSAINNFGRAMFFPQLSLFPVLYLDQDLAVFEFPPLRTKIAVARLAST